MKYHNRGQAVDDNTTHFIHEQRWQPPATTTYKPLRPLTRKQAAFVQHIVDNPTSSGQAAAIAAYGKPGKPLSENTARSIASENLTKPNVMLELAKHSDTAESVLVEVMNYSLQLGKSGTAAGASYASNARQTAQDILDRLHGKATQKTELTTKALTLNIDLTQALTSGSTDVSSTS